MNAGARKATGDVLLFLHADSLLPPSARDRRSRARIAGGAAWGRFDVTIRGAAMGVEARGRHDESALAR